MASFSVRFLGCKVSQTDAQALRERLLATATARSDGRGDVAVVNTCCVTNEGLAKSRQAASRAARTHARVYVTGCGARPRDDAFAGCPRTSPSSRARSSRRSRPSPATSARSAASRPTRRLDRVRAFVKIQDGCSFSCAFCVIPLVRGAHPEPQRRRRARRDPQARRAGAPRDRPHRRQPRLLPRPRRRPHARRR